MLKIRKFNANGKLLLTGEYLVMDGASAFALPTTFGQTLSYSYNNKSVFEWSAFDINGIWFEGTFSTDKFQIIFSSDYKIACTLQIILRKAASLKPEKEILKGRTINTYLNFNRFLGLGSSSTLIALVAALFDVNKYKLHRMVSTGSGYDVACSDYDHPFIFKRKSLDEAVITPLNYSPQFAGCLWFAYLGNKQDTNNEIGKYNSINKNEIKQAIEQVSDITLKLAETKDLTTFVSLIELHENIIGEVLRRTAVKQQQFSDFIGSVKSLGAWGGDFVLMATEKGESYLIEYLAEHNIKTFFRFDDIVLNKPVLNNDDVIVRF